MAHRRRIPLSLRTGRCGRSAPWRGCPDIGSPDLLVDRPRPGSHTGGCRFADPASRPPAPAHEPPSPAVERSAAPLLPSHRPKGSPRHEDPSGRVPFREAPPLPRLPEAPSHQARAMGLLGLPRGNPRAAPGGGGRPPQALSRRPGDTIRARLGGAGAGPLLAGGRPMTGSRSFSVGKIGNPLLIPTGSGSIKELANLSVSRLGLFSVPTPAARSPRGGGPLVFDRWRDSRARPVPSGRPGASREHARP
jgi:hypothetical protein